jgi:hypothetical protein
MWTRHFLIFKQRIYLLFYCDILCYVVLTCRRRRCGDGWKRPFFIFYFTPLFIYSFTLLSIHIAETGGSVNFLKMFYYKFYFILLKYSIWCYLTLRLKTCRRWAKASIRLFYYTFYLILM